MSKGQWVKVYEDNRFIVGEKRREWYDDVWKCSKCGEEVVTHKEWKYCPNCGAELRWLGGIEVQKEYIP